MIHNKIESLNMKSKEVLELLRISRPTLCKYVKEGKIGVIKLHNGFYDYSIDFEKSNW